MLKSEKLLNELAQDLKPVVDKIENCKVKSTQNNYGRYLALISTYAQNKDIAVIVGEAMRRAGGSSAGIAAALRVYGCEKISFISLTE
tara:strand:- start:191 stop:454 length:264 start_codon:yes stop_codon:yes gene_type:complete